MDWTRILAYITGSVDQELLLRNEYLAAENRILRAQLNGCLRLSDAERAARRPCADDHCLARLDSRMLAAAARSNTINRFFIKNGNGDAASRLTSEAPKVRYLF
jgi:putative transposase